jgi:tRNA threonylcarbamoyladenosine biosynthesis protein TsaB
MKILAIEASTQEASCALLIGDAVVERRLDPATPSSETLLPAVRALMAESGIGFDALDAIAYGAGPGGFTGLRVAIGITQGLAFPFDLPVVGVETLAAIAVATLDDDAAADHVLAALDARMNEIYAATYVREGEGVRRTGEIVLASAAALALPAHSSGFRVCGNAVAAYPDLARRLEGWSMSTATLPRARSVARLGALAFARGEGRPADQAAPLYVRDKVALTVSERLAKGGRA